MKRPLLGIAIAFSLGILSARSVNIPVFYCLACFVISLLLSALFIRSKKRFLLCIALGFLFAGALNFKIYNILPKDHIKNIISVMQDAPKQVLLEGQVLNKPVEKLTYYKAKESQFLLGVKALRENNNWSPASGILPVNVFNPPLNFRYGDEVILEGKLYLPKPATNPGQFDYKEFLERKKQFYILKVKEDDFSKITGRRWANPISLSAYKAGENIERLVDKYIPSREGSVLNAILLGERRGIPDDINDNFINTGTVHILSISGLHVGLLAFIFMLLFKILRLPFNISTLIMVSLLVFYSTMTENSPPVVRAAIMISVYLFGRVLRREHDLLNSLAFSALVILFFNPQDLFDIGFQLSFLTMGSIVYFPPKIYEMLKIPPERKNYFLDAVIISFSAWLGSAPFIARYFNICSPVTLIANILVVPWMFFVLAVSVAFIALGSASSLLALIFSEAAGLSAAILINMVSIFPKIPFSYFRVKSPPWVFIIGFYIFLFLFFNRAYFKIRAKYFLIAALVFFNVFVWRGVFFGENRVLRISFLDVGKGESIFLEFPKGGTALIDGGEGLGVNMGRLVVSRFLGSRGINKIDLVVATHPHTDHIGGLVTVLKNFKVGAFIDNGDSGTNPLHEECLGLIKQKKIKRITVRQGDRISGFGKYEFLVLSPPARGNNNLNNNSLVLKLKSGDFSVLFSGDIEEGAARNLLLSEPGQLPSTILKVPHHGGSLGEAGAGFIENVSPRIAVVSSGDREINSDILSALKKLKAQIYQTSKDGAIFLTN